MAGGKGSKKKRPSGKGSARPPAARPPRATGAGGAGTSGAPAQAKDPTTPAGKAAGDGPGRAKPTRAERLEAARRARRRKSLMVRGGVIVAVVALVAAVVIAVAADRRADRADQERLTAGSCDYDTRSDRLTANNHVPPASYEVDPPAGGDHDPSPAPAGFYSGEGQAVPPDPRLVHSLEHGFVVLWHQPGLPEEELGAIRSVYEEHSEDVIVVPRPSLDVKVAATSWGRRLLCGEVEPERLSDFVELYRNDSPEPGVR